MEAFANMVNQKDKFILERVPVIQVMGYYHSFGQKSSCVRHLRGVHDVHDALQLQVGVHEVCKNRGG